MALVPLVSSLSIRTGSEALCFSVRPSQREEPMGAASNCFSVRGISARRFRRLDGRPPTARKPITAGAGSGRLRSCWKNQNTRQHVILFLCMIQCVFKVNQTKLLLGKKFWSRFEEMSAAAGEFKHVDGSFSHQHSASSLLTTSQLLWTSTNTADQFCFHGCKSETFWSDLILKWIL